MRSAWIVAAALAAAACGSGGGGPFTGGGAPAGPDVPAAVDADGDGVPAGEDCDDHDPGVWATTWAYVDADGDGHGAGTLQQACAGHGLRPGWSYDAADCDDRDPARWAATTAFADDDLDGVGAGPAQSICTGGGALPAGWSFMNGDCAPDDGARWQELAFAWRDADGDLRWAASAGTVCAGETLPPGYAATAMGLEGDCDDLDAGGWRAATGYWDRDGDGVGDDVPVALCVGEALPASWAPTGGDCAPDDGTRWQLLSHAGVDGDGDGFTVARPGTVCAGAALPDPFRAALRGADCDDADATRWQLVSAWVDADGDGSGAGPRLEVCVGAAPPVGLAPVDGDCAPLDPAAWSTLTYAYRDADGDGRTAASPGALCAGASLPPGYSNAPSGDDCDDGDPAVWQRVGGYVDADLDGAGVGSWVALCTSGALPGGYAATAGDCAPDDPARWRLASYAGLDRDGDGVTVRAPGQVCAGATLPDPYRATLVGTDCDDADPARRRWVVLYRDLDGDGVGAGPRSIPCLGDGLPAGWSLLGFDADDADSTVQERDDVSTTIVLDL